MRAKIIDGRPYEISDPYSEGHVCNAAEARALNQVRSENIGNNLRSKIKDLHEANDFEGAAKLVELTDREYVFTHATVSARPQKLDPIEKEAQALAIATIKSSLANKGRKIDQVPDTETPDTWAAKVEAETLRIAALPEVLAIAKRNVESKKQAAESVAANL